LFVPAGVEHRFENFSGDLALWVFSTDLKAVKLNGARARIYRASTKTQRFQK